MAYPKKIVLYCPQGYDPRLDSLVEQFIHDGVTFVAVVGEDCDQIEEIIDELVVNLGSSDCDILTSSHPNESVEEVLRFADSLTGTYNGKCRIVEL
jgi:hypothetical protein